MKDNLSIFIAIAAFIYAGVRIYQKYIRKDGANTGTAIKKGGMTNAPKDDDYEPYSKK